MIQIGKERQLFLDDYVLATTRNIDRGIDPAGKHPDNPLIKATDADKHPSIFGTVIPNETSGYDMWYASSDRDRSTSDVNHVVSDDGITWRNPQSSLTPPGGGESSGCFWIQIHR